MPLPVKVEKPFAVRGGTVGKELPLTIDNGKRDGVNIIESEAGSQRAGSIQQASSGRSLKVLKKTKPKMQYVRVPLRYELLLNAKHSPATKYATLAHELGHLYCGHIGTPNMNWWPDRQARDANVCEFEAESVCWLVCSRLGIDNPSDEYLSGYMGQHEETPPISLDCVMKAVGLIEKMGRERLRPRKEKAS